jgi:heat shock protein HslJ
MNKKAEMDLAGSSWTLINFETGTRVISASREAPATLTFSGAGEEVGRLSGSGGCNRYFASYTLTGDRLHIRAMGATRMMCDPPRMEQEDRFFQALSTAERCELSQGELLIAYAGGRLRFAPISAPTGGSVQP